MKRAMTHIIYKVALTLILATGMASCDVHEWPHIEYGEVNSLLTISFETSLPLYREITYARGGNSISWESLYQYDIRYIISVCHTGTRNEARRYTITKPYDGQLDHTVTLPLDEGTWDIYVWADYVDAFSTADRYFNTTDFANITYSDPKNYTGSTDTREAFRGMTTISVTHPDRFLDSQPKPSYHAKVDMVRPMGRYEVLSTDVEEFLTRVTEMRTREAQTKADARQAEDTKADADTRVNIDEFRVIFRYNAFMPYSFNMFTDKPADSWTGISYVSQMALVDEGMLLGFDYVLVNGSETTMNVNIEVYDSDGTLLSITRGIEIPIVRNKLTIVKGEFLTSSAQGGVSINPGYDGDDYNIPI